MSLYTMNTDADVIDPFETVEEALEATGWQFERDEDGSIQIVAETQWGDMGAMFAYRPEPAAMHFSMTLDCKPIQAKRAQVAELVLMANERLWLGHFDYWAEEGVILFRYTFPIADREQVASGALRAVIAAAVSAVDRFVPAFNFVIWAGKSPREAMDAVMFETRGEA